MSDQRNPYCLNYGNVDGRIRFGTLDPTTNTINSIQIESGYADLSTPHYMSFHRDGKFGGGTTFKCPGVFQIECASNPVNNIGFFLHSVDGDIVIGSPNGRVRIFGETVDIIAKGGGNKTGNVNIVGTNKVNIDGKRVDVKGKSALSIGSKGNVYVIASNTLYLTGAFTKGGTTDILGGITGLPKLLSNNGPTELISTVKKIFEDIL